MAHLKNIVISLNTAHERREHIKAEFGKQDIAFEFFDAITPDLINKTCQTLNFNLMDNERLSNGEKGCFLSHVCLWQKMIDEDIPYLAIFEDDVYLGENAHLFFNDDIWIQGYDFVKTEMFDMTCKMSLKKIKLQDNRILGQLTHTHLATAGYIISQKTAKSLLEFIKQQDIKELFPIDNIMFEEYIYQPNSIPFYQICPALVIQHDRYNQFFSANNNHLSSQLSIERTEHRKIHSLDRPEHQKIKKDPLKKIIRELTRPFIQLYQLIYRIIFNSNNKIGFR